MIRRAVVAAGADPADGRRRLYRLECGHTISRRTNGSKRWALCGHCEDREDGLSSSK